MYPFKEGYFAPKNRWYVAAWSDEVARKPMERWIMDQPVAFYRREDGTPVAVESRCPHHLYPLGKSETVGDNIVCGYHGLEFRPDGSCASAPFLEKVPSACRIKSYPVREVWNWIWIWPGDPSLADDGLLPDHEAVGLTDSNFVATQGLRYEIDARYQLINDNLLDLQHVEILHGDNIGAAGIGRAVERRDSGDGWISSFRTLENVELPGPFKPLIEDRLIDRTFGLRFDLPGLHSGFDAWTVPAGETDAGRELGRMNVYHAITPAKRHSCHYFTAFGRNFAKDNDEVGQGMLAALPTTITQDVFAAEEIERMIQASDEKYEEMLFQSDKTLVMGRRMMEKMIEDEMAGEAKV